ncbi:MAG: hypothetical protein COA36_01335 [Desulfotalea sp.]|nr:MAG: hypothetical protein COA36_01335 [Desulfotalea sp.]
MHHIIISDIFGKTKALERFASAFSESVEIFDPYTSEMIGFKKESDAYNYFTKSVGLDSYTDSLSRRIQSISKQVALIGFSIGASAIWKISNREEIKNISRATCFYGSQIRHYKTINPLFTTQLIFPATETHFSVAELIIDLSTKKKVTITQVTFLHGFMNTHSQNFDQAGYSQFTQALCQVNE